MSTDPLPLLETLVAFRSDRLEGDEPKLADHLAALLRARGPDEVTVVEMPRPDAPPTAYVYARYGAPRLLLNAHLDTVPPNADWSTDPFVPKIESGKLFALGASDTKGAAAAILAALDEVRPKDTGILFSGDEEFSSVAMRAFVASEHRRGIERAIVCEPTNLVPGVRHRGFCAFEVSLASPGGHSSLADTIRSPVGRLAHVAVALDAWAERHKPLGPPGFPGMCVNIAKLDGGVAFNVIPAQATLLVSLRPPPGADTKSICAELEGIIRGIAPEATTRWLRTNAPFATRDVAGFGALLGAAPRAPIDLGFWTEAALLADAGVDVVVLGPGSIAQAHAPDEWVLVDELVQARDLFQTVLAATRVG